MAHRGSFRRSGISQSQRRKKSWTNLSVLAQNETEISSVSSNTLNFAQDAGVVAVSSGEFALGYVFDPVSGGPGLEAESTILRIRGSLELEKNSVGIVTTTRAIGIGVMETQAALLGAFPNPATPDGANWDGWLFYRSIAQGAADANAGTLDAKSMRKLPSGSSLIIVMGAQSIQIDGTASIFAPAISGFCTLRALMMLP